MRRQLSLFAFGVLLSIFTPLQQAQAQATKCTAGAPSGDCIFNIYEGTFTNKEAGESFSASDFANVVQALDNDFGYLYLQETSAGSGDIQLRGGGESTANKITNVFLENSDGDAKVGIGITTAPTAKLHIQGDGTTGTAMLIQNGNTIPDPVMVVKERGRVGIGTADPDNILHLFDDLSNGADMQIKLEDNNGNGGNTSWEIWGGEDYRLVSGSGETWFFIDGGIGGGELGDISMGTYPPDAKVHIKGRGAAVPTDKTFLVQNGSNLTTFEVKENGSIIGGNLAAGTDAVGEGAIALGKIDTGSGSDGTGAITLGNGTALSPISATGTGAVAIGNGNTASAQAALALGQYTTASAIYATSMGRETEASGQGSTAMGLWSDAIGIYSLAGGQSTQAVGANSIAYGWEAETIGDNTVALGRNVSAFGDYSVAIGKDVTAPANHMYFGYSATPELVIDGVDNRVGVKVTSPTEDLHVLGTGRFEGLTDTTDSFVCSDIDGVLYDSNSFCAGGLNADPGEIWFLCVDDAGALTASANPCNTTHIDSADDAVRLIAQNAADAASAAQDAADAAQATADTAEGKADTAQTTADTAEGKADAAQTDATQALADAATADGKADNAQATADANKNDILLMMQALADCPCFTAAYETLSGITPYPHPPVHGPGG